MKRLGLALILLCAQVGSGFAAMLPVEPLQIPSTTFSDEEFLAGKAAAGEPVALDGQLILPEGNGPHPIVIALHGSDGENGSASAWPSVVVHGIVKAGFGTLTIDSFGSRGFLEIATDQSRVTQFAQIYDAYRAVEALAADPRVDASRIVLIGFSRGGAATLYAAMTRFQEIYGPRSGSIAGYLPFYPACNFELERGTELVDAPVRIFHGMADDWVSAQTCKAYADRLAAAGADVEITLYDGARHGFDSTTISPFPLKLDDAQSSFDCMRVEVNGVLINRDTGRPFSYDDACVRLGPTVQGNRAAGEAAAAAVVALLEDWIGAP